MTDLEPLTLALVVAQAAVISVMLFDHENSVLVGGGYAGLMMLGLDRIMASMGVPW
jgi:hypothetical protein